MKDTTEGSTEGRSAYYDNLNNENDLHSIQEHETPKVCEYDSSIPLISNCIKCNDLHNNLAVSNQLLSLQIIKNVTLEEKLEK